MFLSRHVTTTALPESRSRLTQVQGGAEGTEHGEESRFSRRGEGRRFLARLVGGWGEKRVRGEGRVLLRGGETSGTGVEESHVRWGEERKFVYDIEKGGFFSLLCRYTRYAIVGKSNYRKKKTFSNKQKPFRTIDHKSLIRFFELFRSY